MKKFLSILLALVMCFAVAVPAFAVNTTGDLKFGTDGKFKIMQIGDTQDMILKDVAEIKLITAALAQDSNNTLWEPGKTQVVYLSLVNNGNLDLKYKVNVNVTEDPDNLREVMKYAITPVLKSRSTLHFLYTRIRSSAGM